MQNINLEWAGNKVFAKKCPNGRYLISYLSSNTGENGSLVAVKFNCPPETKPMVKTNRLSFGSLVKKSASWLLSKFRCLIFIASAVSLATMEMSILLPF